MKQIIKMIVALCVPLVFASCASQVSTKSSLITTVYIAQKREVMTSYAKAVKGMEHYTVDAKQWTKNRVMVKYDPAGLLMGSATVQADFSIKSGLTGDGRKATGVEVIYTDVTPFFSQDSTFSGADIIDRVKSALNDYMDYKGIKYYRIKAN